MQNHSIYHVISGIVVVYKVASLELYGLAEENRQFSPAVGTMSLLLN